MIKLIVFDFDGVIVSGSNQGYFDCYHKAITKVGVTLDFQEERRRILERWGQNHRREIELLLQEYPEKVDEAVSVYEENFTDSVYGENIFLIDGAYSALDVLSKKNILTISSGADRESIEKMISRFNINFFKKIISGYDLKNPDHQKPSPHSVEVILQEFGVSKKEAVMVGDGLTDVQMAQNAGVLPIVVLTGHLSRNEAEKLGVKNIINSINELPKLLSEL